MRSAELEAVLSDVLAASDTPAARNLCRDCRAVLIRRGEAEAVAHARMVLRGVREYVAHERTVKGAGEVGGGTVLGVKNRPAAVKNRPAAVACWWTGSEVLKTRENPLMGFADVGEKLPRHARFWCVPGAPDWFRVPS